VGRRGPALGSDGGRQVHVESQHLAADEQQGAERLILRTGRDLASNGEVGQAVADAVLVDARVRCLLPFADVGQEASDPLGVAALGLVRVVSSADAQPQVLQRGERTRSAVFVDDGAVRPSVPVRSMEKLTK